MRIYFQGTAKAKASSSACWPIPPHGNASSCVGRTGGRCPSWQRLGKAEAVHRSAVGGSGLLQPPQHGDLPPSSHPPPHSPCWSAAGPPQRAGCWAAQGTPNPAAGGSTTGPEGLGGDGGLGKRGEGGRLARGFSDATAPATRARASSPQGNNRDALMHKGSSSSTWLSFLFRGELERR